MSRSKKLKMVGALCFLLIIYLIYRTNPIPPTLKGFYQSEWVSDVGGTEGKIIQISIWEDGRFVEFITNRQVNRGTLKKIDDMQYYFDGNEGDFDIILNSDNSFQIKIPRLNNGEPIELKNVDDIPCTFAAQWDDVEEYKAYLK